MTDCRKTKNTPFREQLKAFEAATNNEDVDALHHLIEPLAMSVTSAFELHEFVIELDTAALLLEIDQGIGMDDFMVFLSTQLRADFMNGAFSDETSIRWGELALTLYRAASRSRCRTHIRC